MTTGALPFTGEVLGAIRALTSSSIRCLPSRPWLLTCPARSIFFFAKAMAKSKEQRFQSVRELVDAFLEIAGGGRAALGSQVSLGHSSSDIDALPVASSAPGPVTNPSGASPTTSGLATVALPATALLPSPIAGAARAR